MIKQQHKFISNPNSPKNIIKSLPHIFEIFDFCHGAEILQFLMKLHNQWEINRKLIYFWIPLICKSCSQFIYVQKYKKKQEMKLPSKNELINENPE